MPTIIRTDGKQNKEVLSLLNKIKKFTNKPHRFNLIDALKYFLEYLKEKK
jgi:hypothetical protein